MNLYVFEGPLTIHSSTITLEAVKWFLLLLNAFFLWSDSFPSIPMNDFILLRNQCYFIDSLEAKMFFLSITLVVLLVRFDFIRFYFGLQFSQCLWKNCMQRDGNLYPGIKFTFKANCSNKLLALYEWQVRSWLASPKSMTILNGYD